MSTGPEYGQEQKLSIWDNIKNVISPVETSDPETHYEDFVSKPLVETALNEISKAKEQFFNRVSQIDRNDIHNSLVVWWKIVYQLLFVLVTAVIGGALFVDATMEGGLV